MPFSSAVRHRVVATANRLLALRDEAASPLQAVNLLIAAGVVPGPALSEDATPFASALRRVVPARSASLVDYLQAAELEGRGDAVLRFFGHLDAASRRWQAPLLFAAVELAALLFVMLIYGIFVLPQLRAVFEGAGERLPRFTELVTAVFAPASPFAWLVVAALLVLFVWRFASPLLGPLIAPLDRLAFALPESGDALRTGNALRLSGWLGHAPADARGAQLAVEAAHAWHPRSTLTRACTRVLAQAGTGREVYAALADAPAFDPEFRATVAITEPEARRMALRARWRTAWGAPEPASGATAKLIHALIVAVIGAVVIALYLPIFKLGAIG